MSVYSIQFFNDIFFNAHSTLNQCTLSHSSLMFLLPLLYLVYDFYNK